MVKQKNGEVYPLLTTDWLGTPTYRQKPEARFVRKDVDEDEDIPVIDDEDEVFDIIDQKKKRSVNLVWLDVFLMVFDFLQVFALVQSMALRWVFPENWFKYTFFTFAFNADAWEMLKFTNDSVYKSVQSYYTPSATVGTSYQNIIYAWFAGAGGLALIYAVLHGAMACLYYPQTWARRFMSWIQFLFVFLIHLLSLPLGTALLKIWECEGEFSKVDTMNEYDCFSTDHWKFLGPSLVYLILVFLVYPAFLIWKIRREGMTGTSDGYLSFLLMKETEYKIHLNRTWLNDSMWLFSSCKHRGRHYRSAVQFSKLILLIICTTAFNKIEVQAMVTTIFFLLCFIAALLVRPFRLTSCNVFLIFSILCNTSSAFVGALLANYTPATTPSAWLTSGYIIYFLLIIQACWLISLAVLLMYLISRTLCHSTKSCYKRAVWPNIATSGSGQLTAETRKFMTAIIKAKIAHEKIQRMPAMFAPVHDLARHIHIINTYCREAEYVGDALHMVLWEVLDDLVETHAEISPRSLFSESVKKSIRKTAAEFMKMVPMFSQRLAQRDYDFILVPPKKKRLLLKMYIIGLFLNGRSEKVARKKLIDTAAEKMWPPLPADREFEDEDGYYEDLYPQPIGDNYSDDLLKVIVDDSTDAESTEEEDNVQGMLRNLPEIGLIDLETPVVEDPEQQKDEDEFDEEDLDKIIPPPFPKQNVKFVTAPRPLSGSSKTSSSSSSSDHRRPSSSASSLFGSQAMLREDTGLITSPKHMLSPPPYEKRPASAGSARSLSPVAPASSPVRPASAGSSHSSRERSPTGRPTSGSSVVSSQPSRRGSQDFSDQEIASTNPGYIPDPEEDDAENVRQGDNPAFLLDEDEDPESMMAAEGDGKRSSKKKKKKKTKKTKKSLERRPSKK